MKVKMNVDVYCEGCDKVTPSTLIFERSMAGVESRTIDIPKGWMFNRKVVYKKWNGFNQRRSPAVLIKSGTEFEVFCQSCYRKNLKARKTDLDADAKMLEGEK